MSLNVAHIQTHRSGVGRFHDLQLSVLERPSRAFSLATEGAQSAVEEITLFAMGSFGCELDENSADGINSHLTDASRVVVLHSGVEILGFAAEKPVDVEDVVYLHGVVVSNKVKRKGAGKALIKMLARRAGKKRLAFTTQNPVMFCVARALLRDRITPSPDVKHIPESLIQDASRLLKSRPGVLDESCLVVRNLYGSCLYPRIPQCLDERVNAWFAESLCITDAQTRDGFLLVGDL